MKYQELYDYKNNQILIYQDDPNEVVPRKIAEVFYIDFSNQKKVTLKESENHKDFSFIRIYRVFSLDGELLMEVSGNSKGLMREKMDHIFKIARRVYRLP